MITIISPTRIEVDGVDAGLPLKFYLDNPGKRSEVDAAFIAWHAAHVIAVQAKDADVAAVKAALDADRAALIAAHEAEIAKLEDDLATLGTKEEAIAIRKAQERANDLKLLAEVTARLRVDEHEEPEPADVKL